MYNHDLLTRLMADFENGHSGTVGNPFDPTLVGDTAGEALDNWHEQHEQTLASIQAFTEAAVRDTPGRHPHSIAIATMLQGLWLGYEYAKAEL